MKGEVAGAGIVTLQTIPGAPAGNVNLLAPRGTVDAGATHLKYHEFDTHHQVDSGYLNSEQGTQPVIEGMWRRQATLFGLDDIYTSIDASYSRGHTTYNGYAIDLASPTGVGTPQTQSMSDMTFDADVRLGRAFRFAMLSVLQVTPYLTYGFHHWTRNGLERYEHQVAGQLALTPAMVAQADVMVGRTFDARMRTPGLPLAVLGSRPTEALGLGLDIAVTRRLHVTLDYRAVTFAYGQSAPANGYFAARYGQWFEPESRSWTQTATVGVAWSL